MTTCMWLEARFFHYTLRLWYTCDTYLCHKCAKLLALNGISILKTMLL